VPTGPRRRAVGACVAALLLLGLPAAAGFALWFFQGRTGHGSGLTTVFSSAEALEAAIRDLGAWAPAGSVALMVLHTFLPFPAELLAIANGLVFGFWLGLALTWGGAMLGALSAFALARRYGRPFVQAVLPERQWRRIEAWSLRAGPGGLLVLRLLPVVSFNLVNFAAGIAGVGWWAFTWTTAVGILPASLACVLAGSRMLEAPLEVSAALSAAILLAVGLRWWWRKLRVPERSARGIG
jgi:uncharacterized membrane protein YdjX (TVP38/TMEM64 family)